MFAELKPQTGMYMSVNFNCDLKKRFEKINKTKATKFKILPKITILCQQIRRKLLIGS